MPKKLVHKRGKPVGAAPGTLIHVGERKSGEVRIHYLDYDADRFEEKEIRPENVRDCFHLKQRSTVSWINVDGLHQPEIIQALGEAFGFHPLVQEDILNTEHRPKFEPFDDYVFIVLKMLFYNPARNEIRTEQVSLILGDGFVLSFQELEGDVFDGVRERLRNAKGRIRKLGADYLAYALIDAIVDSYFLILESIGDRIELLEEQLISDPGQDTLHAIHNFKREMILLRKSVWPLREVISGLQRDETELITETTGVYLRDVYDHTIQVIDTVETFRDHARSLHVEHQQPHERDHESADHHGEHLHSPDLSGRGVRHELRLHARAQMALGLPGPLADHDRYRRGPLRLVQTEEMAVNRSALIARGTIPSVYGDVHV